MFAYLHKLNSKNSKQKQLALQIIPPFLFVNPHKPARFYRKTSLQLIVAEQTILQTVSLLLLEHLIVELHPLFGLLLRHLGLEVVLVLPRCVDIFPAPQVVVSPFQELADDEQTR